ncbi:site-specific integrase [Streptomyces sp. NPDC002926]
MNAEGTCYPCLLAVRLGEDEDWRRAEVRGEFLAPGRHRQLAFYLDGLRLPTVMPYRKRNRSGTASTKARRLTTSSRTSEDGDVCTPQIDGQLGLFATPPRSLRRSHAALLRGRDIPDLPLLLRALEDIAVERGVKDGWRRITRDLGMLALAARDPGERLVRPETLPDLPDMHPTIEEALARACLLAKRRPRIVPKFLLTSGSCSQCLAWANDKWKVCVPCSDWRLKHPEAEPCSRCRRLRPLSKRLCRFCTIVVAENDLDIHGAALDGGDQLWFGGPFTPTMQTDYGPGKSALRKGRFAARRRMAKEAARAARPLSAHLATPGQQMLFVGLDRDWSRIDETDLPALTEAAADLISDFTYYIKERGWALQQIRSSLRVLKILVSHLGVQAPIREADIRALASLSSNHQCPRVIDYLRRRGLLAEDEAVDADLVRARRIAAGLPEPFVSPVNTWIDVLIGQSAKPSLPVAPATAYRYVNDIAPVLNAWAADGITSFREITKEHIKDAVTVEKRARHVGLRSLFRALRRERLIFRDPARTVSLHVTPRLPTPLPSDQLHGLLDKVPGPRDRLIIALVAIHALTPAELRRLPLRGLDRACGQLRVIRPGRPDHIVFLDEFTLTLATSWVAERTRLWPYTTNPHLLVTRVTAASDKNPEVAKVLIQRLFRRIGIRPMKLREDRILDEAHQSADPVHLMRLFGLSQTTAVKYVATAHPADIRPDPIAP